MLGAGEEIILYGSGRRCIRILPRLIKASIVVRAIIDSERTRWGNTIEGIEIQSPIMLRECRNTVLCITVANQAEQKQIRTALVREYGYDLTYEVQYDDLAIDAVLLNHKAKVEKIDFTKAGKPHVVFDCLSGLGLGGIEEWTKGLCIELLEKGFDNIRIFTDTGKYQVQDVLLPIVDGVLEKGQYQFREDILDHIMDCLEELLPLTVITGKPEFLMETAVLLKQLTPDKICIISVIHGREEHLYKLYDRYTAYMDFLVAVSEDIKKDFLERGIPQEKIASITCPVACEEKLERTYTTDEWQPVRIGYAGRLVVTQKRMDLMLNVIEELEQEGVPYVFEIAGDGPYKAKMEEQIRDNKWNDHVRFVGVLERKYIPEFWKRQDIYVNIADAEGRSISQLEAMANGVVPVVTCTSGTREDICDNENGYLVEIGDYRGIADRISYLAGHRKLLSEFGQKAHDAVYPKCQKEIHTKFWETLLRSSYGHN
ncbi:MAG: glycosyltransferase [Ruminococcus sp.]|nr:glycosyltransferase [Ruminococcus sp.]